MLTKEELSQFLRRLADGSGSPSEWEKFATTHFDDEQMETARKLAVKHQLGYGCEQDTLYKTLIAIAESLEAI